MGDALIGPRIETRIPTLATRIQHHPSRAHLIEPLLKSLDGLADVQVITDPVPDGKTDAWRTHRACLETLPADASHLLTVQDDALPVHSFAQKLHESVERHPEAILLAFTPGFKYLTLQMHDARKRGQTEMPYIVRAFVPVVAIVYPREVVSGLLVWVDEQQRPMGGADDGILAHYCRVRRITPLATVPCLVDHDEEILSVGKIHRRPGDHRRAAAL